MASHQCPNKMMSFGDCCTSLIGLWKSSKARESFWNMVSFPKPLDTLRFRGDVNIKCACSWQESRSCHWGFLHSGTLFVDFEVSSHQLVCHRRWLENG